MSATMLMITEVPATAGDLERSVAVWRAHRDAQPDGGSAIYRSLDDTTLLELTAIDAVCELRELRERCRDLSSVLADSLEADIRRQLLEFVEAPKPSATAVPQTPFVQLRHVEVRPRVYDVYRDWRERTIFDIVRAASEVDVFLAYHSVVSTEPGVMFVSGFSCDPEQYAAVFASPQYQEIIRQAGSQYITGGEHGLYTKTYARVDA